MISARNSFSLEASSLFSHFMDIPVDTTKWSGWTKVYTVTEDFNVYDITANLWQFGGSDDLFAWTFDFGSDVSRSDIIDEAVLVDSQERNDATADISYFDSVYGQISEVVEIVSSGLTGLTDTIFSVGYGADGSIASLFEKSINTNPTFGELQAVAYTFGSPGTTGIMDTSPTQFNIIHDEDIVKEESLADRDSMQIANAIFNILAKTFVEVLFEGTKGIKDLPFIVADVIIGEMKRDHELEQRLIHEKDSVKSGELSRQEIRVILESAADGKPESAKEFVEKFYIGDAIKTIEKVASGEPFDSIEASIYSIHDLTEVAARYGFDADAIRHLIKGEGAAIFNAGNTAAKELIASTLLVSLERMGIAPNPDQVKSGNFWAEYVMAGPEILLRSDVERWGYDDVIGAVSPVMYQQILGSMQQLEDTVLSYDITKDGLEFFDLGPRIFEAALSRIDDLEVTILEDPSVNQKLRGDWSIVKNAVGFDGSGGIDVVLATNDSPGEANNKQVRFFGRDGNDIVIGGNGSEVVDGGDGKDIVIGGGGEDVLFHSSGHVYAHLGGNDDVVNVDKLQVFSDSRVYGGAGVDTIYFTGGTIEVGDLSVPAGPPQTTGVFFDLRAHNEFVGFERVSGTGGEDVLIGDASDNILLGLSKDDVLLGGAGNDTLKGGRGNDKLVVGIPLDSVYTRGMNEFDVEKGNIETGTDKLFGGMGGDRFLLDRGQEHEGAFHEVDGGLGDDTVGFVTGVSGVTIDLGTDAFRSIEKVIGTDGTDFLLGDEDQNILIGGRGADHLVAGSDENVLSGGDGDDIFAGKGAVIAGEVSGGGGHDALLLGAQAPRSSERAGFHQSDLDRGRSDSGVSFDLGERSSVLGLEILGRKYTGIETVVGTRHSDTISGDEASNTLETGGGSDTLTGRAGGDTYHVWRNQSSDPEVIRISEEGAPDDVDALVVEYAATEVSYRVPPDSNDLEVILGDGEQTIVIEGQYDDDLRNRIENIRFADGETKALPRKLVAGDEDYLTGDDFVFEIALAVIGEHTTESMPPRLKVFAQADDGSWAHAAQEYELADLTRVSPEDASSLPDGDRHTVTYSVSNERTFKKLYFEIVNGSSAAVAIYSILVNENLVTPETEGWHHLIEGPEEALELTHWIVGLDTPGLIDVDTDEANHEVRDTTERADTVVVREYSFTNVTVDVGSGDDRVRTRDGDDYVVGGSGRDYIWTGGGNDTIVADDDDAVIDGGDGYDLLIMQGSGDKFLDLTVLRVEKVRAGAGNDIVDGRGRSVDLTIDGESGDDLIYGGSGADTIRGGEGVDEIYGLAGADVIYGGVGGDQIQGGLDADTIHGDAGDDSLLGGQGGDTIEGGAGSDVIAGGVGSDTLEGGEGADLLTGGDGSDSLSGGAGSDTLYGDGGNDTLEGGGGDDTLHGGIGDDALAGGDEADTLHGEAGEDALTGGAGDDRLFGGDEADRLVGGVGADELHGGAGDDTLVIDAQDTSVSGGAGFDTVEVEWREDREGVSLDLAAGEIEKIVSTGGDDVLDARGATWAVDIDGGWGQDQIFGGSGADRLTFAYGSKVRGGQGDDTYVAKGLDGNLRDTGGFDTILADGHSTRDDFSFLRVGSALVVVAEAGFAHGTLKIEGHFDGGAVEQLQLGDGGSVIDLTAADLVPDGSVFGQDGDTLVGTAASDTIQVDDGISSKFSGGAGDDTFRIGHEARNYLGYGEHDFGNVEVNGGEGTDTLAVKVVSDFWDEVWKRYIRNGDDLSIEFMGAASGSISLPEFFADGYDGLEVIDIEVSDSTGFSYQNETIDLTDRENLPKVWNLLDADGPTGEVVGTESGDLLRASESQTDLNVGVGGGDDEVWTGAGDDVVTGGPGNDRIYSGAGNDVLDLGSGNDRAGLGTGDDVVHMGEGNDSVYSTYNDRGSNTFYMGGGEDDVRAGDGDDLIVFGMGRSSARGRAGDDTYSIGSSEDHSVFDRGGHDRLVFRHLGRGDLDEVGFERTGHNDRSLVISHAGANVATVSYWFYQNEYREQDYSKIETLELGDGSEFNLLELQRLYEEEGTLVNANPLDPAV